MTKDPKDREEQMTGEEQEPCEEELQEEEKEDVQTEGEDKKEEQKEQTEPKEDESSRYMRLMADFQNYKKRVEKEKSDIYSYANEKLATELLTVLDNFERAQIMAGR